MSPGLNSAILSILTQNALQTTKASQSKQEVRFLQPRDHVVSLCLQHKWFNKLTIFCDHEEATVITPSQHHVTTKQSTKAKTSKNRLLQIKSSGHSDIKPQAACVSVWGLGLTRAFSLTLRFSRTTFPVRNQKKNQSQHIWLCFYKKS